MHFFRFSQRNENKNGFDFSWNDAECNHSRRFVCQYQEEQTGRDQDVNEGSFYMDEWDFYVNHN